MRTDMLAKAEAAGQIAKSSIPQIAQATRLRTIIDMARVHLSQAGLTIHGLIPSITAKRPRTDDDDGACAT